MHQATPICWTAGLITGGKTSISCEVGKEISYAEKGKKTKAIFKITEDMCGNTVKLAGFT